MDKQNKYTNQLLELIQQNPGLRVFPLVHWEVCAGDEHTYWSGNFGESKVDEIYIDDERVWIRSEDEESLIDDVIDNSAYDLLRTDEENEEWAKGVVNSYEWAKVIVVYIET